MADLTVTSAADPDRDAFHLPAEIEPAREGAALTASFVRELRIQGEFWATEQGVALDFAEKNTARLRFVAEDRTWFAWAGTHWSEACAEALAERFYAELIADTLQRAACADGAQREALIERARFMGRRGMRSNALALAQPALMISREAFDRDAENLLNTPSGTVDLRTGALTPCDPARLLTQCTAVPYEPDAPDPVRFQELVYWLAGGDAETWDWLLRALGYSLTGHAHEDAVFYLRGPGGNGKSTLLRAAAAVLGSYAHKLDIRYLTAGADSGHATEYAAIRGKRLIVTSEVERGQKLATSRMKDLSGGDVQAFRDVYQSASAARSFVPVGKLWMAGNHDLAVPGNDHGTWRRIHKIESDHVFPHSSVRDSIVSSEGPGILRVLVEQAERWYREGLGVPPARVAEATAVYRASQDMLGKFFRDCLAFEPGTYVSKGIFNNAYQAWLSEEGGDFRVSPRELAQRLAEHGVTEGKATREVPGRPRVWNGVRLRKASDESDG